MQVTDSLCCNQTTLIEQEWLSKLLPSGIRYLNARLVRLVA